MGGLKTTGFDRSLASVILVEKKQKMKMAKTKKRRGYKRNQTGRELATRAYLEIGEDSIDTQAKNRNALNFASYTTHPKRERRSNFSLFSFAFVPSHEGLQVRFLPSYLFQSL
jgi:hypothetical protein